MTPNPEHDELYRLAVDLSPAGILAVASDGTILLANREIERLFGWRREDLVGRRVEVLLPDRARHGHTQMRTAYFAEPRARHMGAGRDLRGVRKDGTEFPVEVGLNPVRTAQGVVTLASVVDMTARLELERSSRQSQKLEALGTLAGGIAHDFNNILLAIVGHTELAQRGSTGEVSDDLGQVLTAAERGRQLVQRILAFSRTREVKRARVDLARAVREASELLRSSLPSSVRIRLELSPETPHVLSDEIELHQILMNLVTNAAHAMPGGGEVLVATGRFDPSDEWRAQHGSVTAAHLARIVVRDSGTGMPPEVAERVFEPFFTTKAAGAGTGLGLSVVHGIVRDHGGTVELETRMGEGTTFTILLPAANGAPEPEQTKPEAEAARARLLVVEDEVTLGKMEKRLLESMGYKVTLHTGSLEALEDFRQRPLEFDLVMTDNTMPGMTGLQLTQEVRRIRPAMPVMMVSGLAERADEVDLERYGVRVLLRKPHTSQELEQAIREALRQP